SFRLLTKLHGKSFHQVSIGVFAMNTQTRKTKTIRTKQPMIKTQRQRSIIATLLRGSHAANSNPGLSDAHGTDVLYRAACNTPRESCVSRMHRSCATPPANRARLYRLSRLPPRVVHASSLVVHG